MRYDLEAFARFGGAAMSCSMCTQLRLDWLNAMIAADVARMASVTVQAVKHIVKPEPPKDGP